MNTVEEFKDLAAKYQTDKSIKNALRLGSALLILRKRTVEAASGDWAEADLREDKLLGWFKISNATARRLKLLANWKKEIKAMKPGSLTDAYQIAERLNAAALQKENAEVNRGGRPRKSDAERSLEYLKLAADHWLASGRPSLEFVERARMAVED